MRRLAERIYRWFRPRREESHSPDPRHVRGRVDHVVILDGTMASLEEGAISNAGLTRQLLCELLPSAHLSLYYETGIQWQSWRQSADVISGRGINRQIRRAYGFLASRYRPGDRIYILGYSRGAYAARSLGGVIDRMGLVRRDAATTRNIRQIYRYYQFSPDSEGAQAFRRAYCHEQVEIEMIGVWDTVKALGLRLPVLWRLTEANHAFHNHHLGPAIRHGFQALALDETRAAYTPILWEAPDGWTGQVHQMWFRGTHGDVGGHLTGFDPARPLSNIPLVWMLERAEVCGLPLPAGWHDRFPQDPDAPSVGTWRGWGKVFLLRERRVVGRNPSEAVHPTAEPHLDRAPVKFASGREPLVKDVARENAAEFPEADASRT